MRSQSELACLNHKLNTLVIELVLSHFRCISSILEVSLCEFIAAFLFCFLFECVNKSVMEYQANVRL